MSLKKTYLVVVYNVRSTVVYNMERLLDLLPRNAVQLTNLPLPELYRVSRFTQEVVKYAEVSSRLKTLK